jgi:hypothetical protein
MNNLYTKNHTEREHLNRGYTLLFAVLTAAVVLGIGAFILGVARKQYILSSTARDSMYAFYAADSGIECVAGNDNALSSTTPSPNNLICNGKIVPVTYAGNNPNGSTYNLGAGSMSSISGASFSIPFHSNPADISSAPWGCAVISIDEFVYNGILYSVVQSRGYNLCESIGGTEYGPANSPRTVERALQWVSR